MLGTHHFIQKNNKECTGGIHDISFGTNQNFILQGSLIKYNILACNNSTYFHMVKNQLINYL